MSWSATLNITNNTSYNITVTHNATGDLTTIAPGDKWSVTTSEVNNTNALKFWQQPQVYYMQGSVSFGPEAGVYMDRGWQAPGDQSIKLVAAANGVTYIQTQNGGATVLPWNGFEQGGIIDMTFAAVQSLPVE
jgi:hypothetical protein